MMAGSRGSTGPPPDGARIPLRLRRCLGEVGPHPPPQGSWEFYVAKPPYEKIETVRSFTEVLGFSGCRGLLVMGTPERPDLDSCGDQVDPVRALLPWCSLVVRPHAGMPSRTLMAYLNRLSRHGAVSVAPETLHAREIADQVLTAFDPSTDLRIYFRTVLPRLRPAVRANATEGFVEGWSLVQDDTAPREQQPSRRYPLWTQIGRAVRAANVCQTQTRSSESRLPTQEAIAGSAGYHDARSMNRAFLRAFGVTAAQITGTVGWEWLLWRFLCGHGKGKLMNWDQ
jgi:hypothetical protein